MHHVFVQISPTIGIVKHICSSSLFDHYTFVGCFPSSSSKGRKCTDHANLHVFTKHASHFYSSVFIS